VYSEARAAIFGYLLKDKGDAAESSSGAFHLWGKEQIIV
jgi:hypothetical protein